MKYCWGCMSEMKEDEVICPYCGFINEKLSGPGFSLVPGTVLKNRFIIGRVLGCGGFGITYIAKDTLLHRVVAIKEYFPTTHATRIPGEKTVAMLYKHDDAEYLAGLDRFVDEAQRITALEDIDGVVTAFDCFLENNTAYLVMEYLEGETLKDYINKKGVLKSDEAFTIIHSILTSLEKIHQNGIIHRDVSPDNIFLTNSQKVKLIDFGAARRTSTDLTRSLSVILKPGYSAEEQYRRHGSQGPWTDVYGAGATLYYMLTGVKPPNSIDRFEKDNLRPPQELGADITEHQQAVLMKSLSLMAEDRYQSADDFIQDLTDGESNRNDGKSKSAPIKKEKDKINMCRMGNAPEKKNSFPFSILAISAGVIALTALGTIFYLRSPKMSEYESELNAEESEYAGHPSPTPTATPTPAPTPEPTSTSVPEQTVVIGHTPGGIEIKEDNSAYKAKADINIRSDANAGSDIIGEVLADTIVISTGISDNGWVRVVYNDKTGYVSGDYLENDFEIEWKDRYLEQAIKNITGIKDRPVLYSDVKEISFLSLGDRKISDITGLECFSSLESLFIYHNNISDISALAYLNKLTNLHLSYNNISDISALTNANKLTELDLSENNISEINALSSLSNLKSLNLNYNNIRDINALASLKTLEDLNLRDNNIRDISVLGSLNNLTSLNLKNNSISDIRALISLNNLTSLNIGNNSISDISTLAKLTNLRDLTLSGNPIDDYSPIQNIDYYYKYF